MATAEDIQGVLATIIALKQAYDAFQPKETPKQQYAEPISPPQAPKEEPLKQAYESVLKPMKLEYKS